MPGDFARRDPTPGQKIFDIAAAKTHDSPNLITRQFATLDEPIDRHRIHVEQAGKLPNGEELTRGYVGNFVLGFGSFFHQMAPRNVSP